VKNNGVSKAAMKYGGNENQSIDESGEKYQWRNVK